MMGLWFLMVICCLGIDSRFVTTVPIVFAHRDLLLRGPIPSQTHGPERQGKKATGWIELKG